MKNRCRDRSSEGVTLIEILIVIIFLSILAAIIVPTFVPPIQVTENMAFVSSVKDMARAFEVYRLKTGGFPAESETGMTPPEMKNYLEPDQWPDRSPIGGQWNWDYRTGGVTAAIGVTSPDRNDVEMTEIDTTLDDGNLATGTFRKTRNGYMFILVE